MVTVGVTGGIGSGKSTFCNLLAGWGAHVFSADEVARRLMESDPTVRKEVIEAFGQEAYAQDGKLNRAWLADQVFGNPDRLAILNGIVHPRVYRAFDAFVLDARRAGARLVVRESALLPQGAARSGLDLLVVITAPDKARIRRVVQRDGVSETDVEKRMGHQFSQEEFHSLADRIVENTGSVEDLKEAARRFYSDVVGQPPDQ